MYLMKILFKNTCLQLVQLYANPTVSFKARTFLYHKHIPNQT